MAKSVAAGKNLDERSKVFDATDGAVINFSNLNGGCAGFNFLQGSFGQRPVSSCYSYAPVF